MEPGWAADEDQDFMWGNERPIALLPEKENQAFPSADESAQTCVGMIIFEEDEDDEEEDEDDDYLGPKKILP